MLRLTSTSGWSSAGVVPGRTCVVDRGSDVADVGRQAAGGEVERGAGENEDPRGTIVLRQGRPQWRQAELQSGSIVERQAVAAQDMPQGGIGEPIT